MKIIIEETVDEAVDAQLRLLEHSDTARKSKRLGLLYAPLLFAGFYFGIPDTQEVKLIFASLTLIMFIAYYLIGYKKMIRKRTRKIVTELLETDKPFPCEYELDEDGIAHRSLGTEIRFQWNKIIKINEDDKYLEFLAGKSGIVLVPKRAFENEEQQNEWLHFAKEKTGHLQQSVQS